MVNWKELDWKTVKEALANLTSDTVQVCKTQLTKDNAKWFGTCLLTVYGYYMVSKYCIMAGRGLWKLYNTKVYSDQVKQQTLAKTFGNCKNSWAVITGCTSGIGLEIAKILSLCHFNLLLISRSEDKLVELQSQLSHQFIKNKVEYLVLDFEEEKVETIHSKLNTICEEHGIYEIKLLVNNVGGMKYKPFIDLTADEVRRDLNLNLKSHVALTTFFENKIKRETLDGHSGIIFIGSILGCCPIPAFGTYSFCKSFLTQLTRVVNKRYSSYYSTMISNPGQVLSNLNNPYRDTVPDYRDVDPKKLSSSWVTAEDCAKYSLLSFGFRTETGGHPRHEMMRQYIGMFAYPFKLMFLAGVSRKRKLALAQEQQNAVQA